jgi:hypothetical protein
MTLRRLLGSVTALVALTAAGFLYVAHPVRGSDHQDAPAVLAQPPADITDLYVFPATNPNNVVLVMNVDPLLTPSNTSAARFSNNTLYQFKIVNGPVGTKNPENTVIQLLATGTGANQTLTLYGPAAPAMTGINSVPVAPTGTFGFNKLAILPGNIIAFAGPRADPFFFDLFQFFKILPDRNYQNPRSGDTLGSSTPTFNGYPTGSTSGPSGSGYACSTAPSQNALTQAAPPGFNVLSIALSIPRTMLAPAGTNSIIHVWATTSVAIGPFHGKTLYRQIELLSRPAVKELFEVFDNHSVTNVKSPYNDPTIHNAIGFFMTNVAGRSAQITAVAQAVLYPNELAADLSQSGPAAYLGVETGGATGGKFGGRGLADNVIDISLGAVFGPTIPALGLAPDDGKENNCLTSQHVTLGQGGQQSMSTYPFLAPPH